MFAEVGAFVGSAVLLSCCCIPKRYRPRVRQTQAQSTCAICLQDIPKNATVLDTPCIHNFHAPCLLRWLRITPSCPLCSCDLSDLKPP